MNPWPLVIMCLCAVPLVFIIVGAVRIVEKIRKNKEHSRWLDAQAYAKEQELEELGEPIDGRFEDA